MTMTELLALQRTRGMRDMLPPTMQSFRGVEDAFRAAASSWDYHEIRTPTIESYSLFSAAGALTPQMLSRVYSFLDWDGWSGERVVLRPDSTIPVARAALQAGIPFPARLFYVQSRFRFADGDEEREDWQCGAEFLGAPSLLGEIEVVAVGCEALEALGLAPLVRINHVGVVRALVDALALGPAEAQRVRDALTSRGLEALDAAAGGPLLGAFVAAARATVGGVAFIDNLDSLAGDNAALRVALADLRTVVDLLASSGRDVTVDFSMPSDFEYYTGAVFEFTALGETWGRGGRYALPQVLGGATACGLGLEAGSLAQHVARAFEPGIAVAVVPASAADIAGALALAHELHQHGVVAALEHDLSDHALAVRVDGGRISTIADGQSSQVVGLEDILRLVLRQK